MRILTTLCSVAICFTLLWAPTARDEASEKEFRSLPRRVSQADVYVKTRWETYVCAPRPMGGRSGILLHRLWVTGEVYKLLRNAKKFAPRLKKAAA